MMFAAPIVRRIGTGAAVLLLCAALAACFVVPGKFTAALDLRKDGTFSYSYSGEIFVLGLSQMAQAGQKGDAPFEPEPCFTDDQAMSPRKCSDAEIEAQRKAWSEARAASEEGRKKDAEKMKALLGGLDPSDPKAGEELAARLRRQSGWKSVVYKGDGLYQVEFALSGRLDHDFTFPTIERMPMLIPFVTISRRVDGTVRIDAPAFSGSNGGGMGPLAAMAAQNGEGGKMPDLPQLDGRFSIVTDGRILANDTDEGPLSVAGGQRLDWTVNQRTASAPTALIQLAR